MSSSTVERRTILRAATLAAALPVLTPRLASAATTNPAPSTALAPAPATWSVRPFALGDVSLGDGLLTRKRQLMLDYGRGYDVDRLLQVFRANAGLPTLSAVAPGGWEGLDGEANGNLRGHYTGHFMSMLSQAYASTRDETYAERLRYMVGALVDVRAALRTEPSVLAAPGRVGGGVELQRGASQFIDLPTAAVGTPADFTFAAWVRPTHDARWTRLFDFGNDTTRYAYLTTANQAGVPRFAITTSGAGGERAVNGTAPLPVGQWSHLALTIAGTTATLYVNGLPVGVNTSMSVTLATLGQVAHHWLGRSHYPDPTFSGVLDEVNLWSRGLSAVEIDSLAKGSAAASLSGRGDLASYDLDETTGATLADASGRSQDATLRRTWGSPSHPGFLAAYPETQFITLESMTSGNYTVVWAPYYTAHKILRGLLDTYVNIGDERALDLAEGMCDWMYSRLSALPAATLQRMWGIFSSGEFGGIVEAICDLHAVTGKPEHVALARLFDLNRLIDSCAAGTDILDGMHANQHIPILTGLLRLHDETGEQRYLDAARGFWGMVVPPRMHSIGGTSTGEFWRARGSIAGSISETSDETCCAYNMLKLSRMLFFHEQDPKYMEYYERALLNQVLGSKQDQPDAEKPLVTYFIGLTPGHVRDYTPKQGTTCCEGTGMESATKYQDSVFFAAADGSALYVNLYAPATVTWAERGITVMQTTDFPYEQGTTLSVRGSGAFDLLLRVPSWARRGFTVTVNGKAVTGTPTPGTYFRVSRTWRSGDTVRVSMPFTTRTESALDDGSLQTILHGPLVLAARDARRELLPLSLSRHIGLSGDLAPSLVPVPGKPLHFTVGDVELAPFFEGTEDPTHVYIRRWEPTIVFAGLDSGVPNTARGDGVTFLDLAWKPAPFAGKVDLRKHVEALASVWVADGLMTSAERDRVLATVRDAKFAA